MLFNNASVADAQFWLRGLPLALCDWFVPEADRPAQCSGLGYRSSHRPCLRD